MESVESLCDHIALLNRSKLLLSGELRNIQQQFQKNRYEVGIIPFENTSFDELETHYKLSQANFPSIQNEKKWLIELHEEQNPQELLQYLFHGNRNFQAERSKSHCHTMIPVGMDGYIRGNLGRNSYPQLTIGDAYLS